MNENVTCLVKSYMLYKQHHIYLAITPKLLALISPIKSMNSKLHNFILLFIVHATVVDLAGEQGVANTQPPIKTWHLCCIVTLS